MRSARPTSSGAARPGRRARRLRRRHLASRPRRPSRRRATCRPARRAGPGAGPAPEAARESTAGSPASAAITAANRESTVEPDDASMRGATWYIEDVAARR